MVTTQNLLQLSNSDPLASGNFTYDAYVPNQYELVEEAVIEYYWAGPITGWRIDDRDRPDSPVSDQERPLDRRYEDEGYYHPYSWDVGGGYTDETLPQYVPYV